VVAAYGGGVGGHLGEHTELWLCLAEQRHVRERAPQPRDQGQQHVVAAAQVGAFVGEDRTDLPWGECCEGTGRDHDLVAAAGQAVDGGGIVVHDRHTQLGAGRPVVAARAACSRRSRRPRYSSQAKHPAARSRSAMLFRHGKTRKCAHYHVRQLRRRCRPA
jgi:hypothetical protein